LPETLIGGNPDFFLRQKMASQTKSKLSMRSIRARLGALSRGIPRSQRVHAMCEDYRAGAYADFEIDKKIATAGNKIRSDAGAVGRCRIASAAATPLDTGRLGRPM